MSKKNTKRADAAKSAEIDSGGSDERQGRRFPSRLAFVLIAVIAVVFAIYSVVTLVNQQAQITERRGELEEILDEIAVQEIKNDEMSKTYNLSEEERSDYIERIARDDLDYVKEGERVFVNVSGD